MAKAKRIRTAAIDAGNGTTVVASYDSGAGGIRVSASPSVFAEVSTNQVNYEGMDDRQAYVIDSHAVVIGDDIRTIDQRINTATGETTYGSMDRYIPAVINLHRTGIAHKQAMDALVVMVPPGMMDEYGEKVRSSFDRPLMIEDGGNNFVYRFNKVDVYPEAASASRAIIYDDNFNQISHPVFVEPTVLLDFGTMTVDIIGFYNGKMMKENAPRFTNARVGVNLMIRKHIIDHLKNEGHSYLSEYQVDDAIRCFHSDKSANPRAIISDMRLPGNQLDITDQFEQLRRRYATDMVRILDQTVSNAKSDVKHIVLTGGAAWMVQDAFADFFNDALFDPTIIDHLKKPDIDGLDFTAWDGSLHPMYWNAIGALKQLIRKLRK